MNTSMTGRERLFSAIRHQEPDRVPVAPRIWAYLIPYYGEGGWLQVLRAAREFGFDFCEPLACPVHNFMEAIFSQGSLPPEVRLKQEVEEEAGAVTVHRHFETPVGPLSDETWIPPHGREYGIGPNPVKREHLLKDADDLARIGYLLTPPEAMVFTEYHKVDEIVGDAGFPELTINPPIDHFLGDARGLEQLMMDYYLDRPLFDAMIAFFEQYAFQVLERALEQGVRFIFDTWYYSSLSAGWSPAIFHECFTPLIRQHAELVHKYDGIYHVYDDGKLMGTLGEYVNAGADVVETLTPPPVGDVDLAEAKRLYGDKTCLKGYIDLLYVLKLGTPELIDQTVRDAIEIAAPGGGFILGTSDSIRDGTPEANVRAYFSAARRYGSYPHSS
jgi:hypothetical protein